MPTLPFCFEDTGIGGCVDYQFRMVSSPLTFLVLLMLGSGILEWNLPCLMIIPYALGRIVTGLAANPEHQIFGATPLLAVAYFWGHVSYSLTPAWDAALMLGFSVGLSCLCLLILVPSGILSNDVAADISQLAPFLLGCIFSWIKLAQLKNWFWFAGLAWGMGVPAILPMLGIPPYAPLGPSYPILDGPVLWYSDSMVTLPLAVFGMVKAGMLGKPAMLKDHVA